MSSPSTKLALGGFPLFPFFYSLSALRCMMAWFAINITNAFLFESLGVRNFGFFLSKFADLCLYLFVSVWTKFALVVICFALAAFFSLWFVSFIMM